MKRIFLLLSLIFVTLCSFALETKKVAILEVVDKKNELSYYQKLMLRSKLAEEVNKAFGFEAYDRSNMDAIMNEHNFQRTGFVSQDQIRQLGEMAGAAYILIIEGAVSQSGYIFVSSVVLDVETGQMVVTESVNMASSEEGMQQGCASLAKKVFGKLKGASAAYVQEQKRLQQEQQREQQRLLQEQKAAEEAERAKYYVYQKKNKYIYLESEMDKKAYANFLKTNCPDAYKQFNKGKKAIIGGWCLFGLGFACAAGGGIHYYMVEKNYWECRDDKFAANYSNKQNKIINTKYDTYNIISYSIMGAGGAMVLTSIPVLSAGYSLQKKSMITYNKQCSSPSIPPLTLNLTAGQNGLGLALNF